jgi:hypothetical protein
VGVQFEPGDLVMFRHLQHGRETQSGGIVINLDDGLLTVALPQGVEVWNMRGPGFGSAWRVEHTPGPLTEDEALAFAAQRLAELRRHPLVLVEPEDDRLFTSEPHEPHEPHDHLATPDAHQHRHVATHPR